jgi:hypothetical protein
MQYQAFGMGFTTSSLLEIVFAKILGDIFTSVFKMLFIGEFFEDLARTSLEHRNLIHTHSVNVGLILTKVE